MTEAMTEAALFELLSLDCRVDSGGGVCHYNTQGHLHRVYGPAIEYSNGNRTWYINGKVLTEAEWQQAVSSMENV